MSVLPSAVICLLVLGSALGMYAVLSHCAMWLIERGRTGRPSVSAGGRGVVVGAGLRLGRRRPGASSSVERAA